MCEAPVDSDVAQVVYGYAEQAERACGNPRPEVPTHGCCSVETLALCRWLKSSMGTWRGIRSKAEAAAQADSNVQAGMQQLVSLLGITHSTLCYAVQFELVCQVDNLAFEHTTHAEVEAGAWFADC